MQRENEIRIHVETVYLETQSIPEDERYVFRYTITIHNTGNSPAKLLNRHWLITDANGRVEEVRGEGVVGEQPYLRPGDAFRYTSGSIIETPLGSMEGEYEMVDNDGNRFMAQIPLFSLAVPSKLH